jgi:small-conductance mechanosensitive channel
MVAMSRIDASLLGLLGQIQTNLFQKINFTNLAIISVTLGLVWLLLRYLSKLLKAISDRQPHMRFMILFLEPGVRILLWFSALIFAVQILAPSQDAFLAAIGSAALAVGLGAQDLIKNLIGGLVILADRPYQIGDRVRIGEAYGEIGQIGLRSTKLTTPDDTRVTIPNADILTTKTFNANSGVPDCQVVTDVFLPPDIDPTEVLRVGREVAVVSPYTYLAKPISVLLIDGYSETPFVTLRIKAYVYDHRYEPMMQSDVVRRCKLEFLRLGLLEGWKEQKG